MTSPGGPPPKFWDDRYRGEEFVYGKTPNTFLRERCGAIVAGGKVLCVGAGEGRNAVFLASLGYHVVAVDGSAEGGRKTRALAAEQEVTVETITADLATFDIESEAFDGIVSIFCHLPPTVRKTLHHNVVGGLTAGGALVMEAYTPAQLQLDTGGPQVAAMLYALDTLREDLNGLSFEHAQELERNVVEGRFHTGRAAVVQLIGRK